MYGCYYSFLSIRRGNHNVICVITAIDFIRV
jgi:hypothetical protein